MKSCTFKLFHVLSFLTLGLFLTDLAGDVFISPCVKYSRYSLKKVLLYGAARVERPVNFKLRCFAALGLKRYSLKEYLT